MQRNLIILSALSLSAVGCVGDDATGSGADETATGATDTGEATGSPTSADGSSDGVDTTVGADESTGATSGGEEAMVRVVHAAPGAPAVDVYVAGVDEPLITNLAYTETSQYVAVPGGAYNFQVRAADAQSDSEPEFETGEIELAGGAQVTAVAAGVFGSKAEEDAFRVIPMIEGFEDPGEGNAAVRIVHAGSDAPDVGIDIGNDDPALPELDGVARFSDSGEAGVPLPAGAPLQVGIAAEGATVTAFTTPPVPPGVELFVIATGLLGSLPREDVGFGLLAVGPDGTIGLIRQNPVVHALHGSWDAGTVDLCTGTTELFGNLGYGGFGSIQIPPGDYPISVFAGSAEDCSGPRALYTSPDVELEAGEQYLAVAAGAVGAEPALQFIVAQEQFALDAEGGVLGVLHAAGTPDIDAVEIGLVDKAGEIETEDSVVVDALAFGDESDAVELPVGEYPVGIAADVMGEANYPNTAVLTADLTVTEGMRAYVIASGLLGAQQKMNALTLNIIDTTTAPWTCVTCP